MAAPLSAAEFLARFYATEPVAFNYQAPSDLFNELEIEALATTFGPSTLPTSAGGPVPSHRAGGPDSSR